MDPPCMNRAMMAVQMAAGAERERLERRVQELDAEVRLLRRVLADVVRSASQAIDHRGDSVHGT